MVENIYFSINPQICDQNVGKVLGSGENVGQCAAGVQELFEKANNPLKKTNTWKKGELVRGNKNIPKGTAIATFDNNGKYWTHAAVYEGQNQKGIQVWDQWVGHAWSKRTINFNDDPNNYVDPSNDGNCFYTISK
jgi:hypothetical protein